MGLQMKILLIISLFLLILQGCGNSSEPTVQIKEIVKDKEIVQVEKNITTMHIRVLKLDEKSKIPEHLIKIPIYQN